MNDLESRIIDLESRGLWLANLFRLAPGRYRANIGGFEGGFEFGEGASPGQALDAAITAISGPAMPWIESASRVILRRSAIAVHGDSVVSGKSLEDLGL